jgi:hypothetical protein
MNRDKITKKTEKKEGQEKSEINVDTIRRRKLKGKRNEKNESLKISYKLFDNGRLIVN